MGVGNIGTRVAMIARGFGMDAILFDPGVLPTKLEQFGRVVELDDLLQESDFVTVHVPLTKETTGLFGAHSLEQ